MKKYLTALDDLFNTYDAFYFSNKYCNDDLEGNTHREQLLLLKDLFKDDMVCMKALGWIQNCYDCYYKKDFENDEDSAFAYLKDKINELEGNENNEN